MSKTHVASLYEKSTIDKVNTAREVPSFRAGDTVAVKLRILDGTSERISVLQGVCIARSNKGINSSFTVRKISGDIGTERMISLYSPLVAGIEVVRFGKVRRAKLFYLRSLKGKKARIKEKTTYATKKKS